MRKIFVLLLILLVLTGCGQPSTPSQSKEQSKPKDQGPTKADRENFAKVIEWDLESGQFQHDNEWETQLVWRDRDSFSVLTEGPQGEILNIEYERMSLVIVDHLIHARLNGHYHHLTLMEKAKELGFKKIVCQTGSKRKGTLWSAGESWSWDLMNEKYEIKGDVWE